jgi:hypothetical protein
LKLLFKKCLFKDEVDRTLQQVQAGERNLRRAVASNSAKYPAVAAAVGGVALGGPVGVAAGSAIAGIVAAVGGAFAGFHFLQIKTNTAFFTSMLESLIPYIFTGLYGGKLLKKQSQKQATGPFPTSN